MKKYLLYSVLLLLMAIPANSAGMNKNMVAEGEGTTYISDHYLKNQKVHYKIYNGLAIMDGDILLGTVEEVEKQKKLYESNITARAAGVFSHNRRWKNGIIPYVFDSTVSSTTRNDTLRAMQRWNTTTPIRFVARSNQEYYITINSKIKRACFATLGFLPGYHNHEVNLASNCGYGGALHELGHVIGLHHEHNRMDRDNYIAMHWNNIPEVWKSQFEKYNKITGIDIGPYDYYSIMHYPADPFSEGYDWYTAIYANTSSVGLQTELSNGDINGVRKLYSDSVANMTSPSNGSRLSGRTVTFRWNKTYGNNVHISIRSGNQYIVSKSMYTNVLTVNNLPTDGRDISVRLTTFTTSENVIRKYNYKAFLAKPSKPSSLTTADIGSSQVTLRWRDNSNNEKGFRIYRGNTLIKTLPANTRSYTITNLNENTAYTYTIRSYNDAGVSAPITVKFVTKKINMSSWYVPVDYNMVY